MNVDPMVIGEFGTGQVFWSLMWFFIWVLWLFLVVTILTEVFRSHDLSGWGKALWTAFVIVLPFLGVFVYLIVRGAKMNPRSLR
jgi:hypothetical protein